MRGPASILYRPRVTQDPRGDEEGYGAAHGELGAASRHLIEQYGRPFVQGDILFREGEAATHAFLLHEGRVRLLKRVRMVERSLSVLRPGDLFGEGAILDGAVRMSTAVALSDGIMLSLDRTALRVIVERFPQLAERILTQLARRLRDAEDQIEVLMLRDTQSKVVSALLKMTQNQPGPVELTVSPVDLSSRVGLDVETVKRTVQRLRDQQYLRIVGERVEIPDVDALRRLYALLGTKDELRGER
ncbi:MAG: Crp/Fnr family transcriptional regulator [Labilithrix sp.]|nr:Crp/Fnr family transcriptional regulator [Labilithrix sp.]MBX3224503.1 Crp/Fnr family transcriptional regulator [Labilithrix sp.]